MNDAHQARRYFVSGTVQGVGFRYFTKHAAEKLHLTGYVRNLPDGRVEVFAIGTPEQLSSLRDTLQKGPRFSHVAAVQEESAVPDLQFEKHFVIR